MAKRVAADREETRAKFQALFCADAACARFRPCLWPMRKAAWACFRSRAAIRNFLTVAHLEMIKVLASQATVALRNASLIQGGAFHRRAAAADSEKAEASWRSINIAAPPWIAAAVGAAVLFLMRSFHCHLRVEGPAISCPRTRCARRNRSRRRGEAGQRERRRPRSQGVPPLEALKDWDYRSALAAARAKRETAIHSDESGSGGERRHRRPASGRRKPTYWTAEVARARRAPGQNPWCAPRLTASIATPHMENLVGRKLKIGDTFADIVDNSQALVDLTIDQMRYWPRGGWIRKHASSSMASRRTRSTERVVVISPLGTTGG